MASKSKSTDKKMVKYCNIMTFLDDHDSDLGSAINKLCLTRSLQPRQSGITFLYPAEKSYHKDILEKAYSESPEHAVEMIKSLIIPVALLTAQDFKKNSIGSLNGVGYTVKSAGSDGVVLEGSNGDVTLKLNSSFKYLNKKSAGDDSIAVWDVVSGRLPLTGAEYKRASTKKTGKGDKVYEGGAISASQRAILAAKVENKFRMCCIRQGDKTYDPYLAKTVGLLDYLNKNHKDLLTKLIPIVDYSPIVTFYLLVEPYKLKPPYLIPDEVLFGEHGWNCVVPFGDLSLLWQTILNGFFGAGTAKVFSDRASVAQQIDLARQSLIDDQKGIGTVSNVIGKYSSFMSSNSISGLSPILPDGTTALLSASKKLWQDEFRYILYSSFQAVKTGMRGDKEGAFDKVLEFVQIYCPGNDYDKERRITNPNSFNVPSPNGIYNELMCFINSTDFMYLSLPTAMSSQTNFGSGFFNRNAEALQGMSSIHMQKDTLSKKTLYELQTYVAQFGTDKIMTMLKPE